MKITGKFIKTTVLVLATLSALCLTGVNSSAQELGFNTRTSAEVDWEIINGLHLSADYELRTKNSLAGIERHQGSIGIDWKVCPYFKIGGEYIFIANFSSANKFRPRHRLSLNLTGQYDAGAWRFSLREKLQLTHNAYDLNRFQDVPNALQLKSRFTIKYRRFRHIEPYAYFEMRNIFNAPKCTANWDEAKAVYTDYEFLGYNHAYVNRLRGTLGLDWLITKQHSIDFSLMYNWVHNLEIDTNKEGTKLKGLNWENSNALSLCVGYKFSF